MKQQNSRCLVLNADFTPLSVINWRKALVLSLRHNEDKNIGVEIIDFYKDDFISGTNGKRFPIPAVVKTVKYFRIHNQQVKFSRKNIFLRDDYTCQYCGLYKDTIDLTYDHVIPKSLWDRNLQSPTNWTNIVTACISCNRKKGNRTPRQANMPLKNLPIAPTKSSKFLPLASTIFKIRSDIPSEWTIYLPQSYI